MCPLRTFPIFSNLGILKFFDLVEVLNILFVHQHSNQGLPMDLLDSLTFSKISHSFDTRGNALGLLQIPSFKTSFYGLHSFSRLAIQQWNYLQRCFPNLNLSQISFAKLKSLLRKFYLNSYE